MYITYWINKETGVVHKIDEDTSNGMSFLNCDENKGKIEKVTKEDYEK